MIWRRRPPPRPTSRPADRGATRTRLASRTDVLKPRSSQDLVRAARAAGVTDERVLRALGEVRRERYVPAIWRERAYLDEPIPIGSQQVTTQPTLAARMVEALRLRGDERVLEVGAGLGFQAALLARLCREVVTVEWFVELAARARGNLRADRVENVTVVHGDGTRGLPERAPFDAIIVAAAAPAVAPALVEQLAEGGRLVQPIGPGGDEVVTVYVKRGGRLEEEALLVAASFVPLRGPHGVR